MKKYIVSIAISMTVMSLAVAFIVPTQTQAQVSCPAGYTCTPITQVPNCPSGYTCTPVTSSPNACYTFSRNLGVGSYGQDVQQLTSILTNQGFLNGSTNSYDESVAAAVTSFQEKYSSDVLVPNGLSNGTGYVGRSTRTKLNQLCGTITPVSQPVTQLPTVTPTPSWSVTPTSPVSSLPPTIYYFSTLTSNVNAGQSDTLSWEAGNANFCYITANPSTGGSSQVGGSLPSLGTYSVTPNVTTSYTLGCYNAYNSKDGQTVPTKSTTVTVLGYQNTAPTCTLASDKSSYNLGDTITFSWTSQNATYANWLQDTSGKDHLNLPGDKLSASGSQPVTANVIGNPSATLSINGYGGSATCSKTINVVGPVSTPTNNATIDQGTLKVMPNTAFRLTGNTSVLSGSLTVVIIGQNYTGATDWNTIGNLLKGGSSYTVVGNTAPVQALANAQSYQMWSTSFGGIPSEGYYTVLVYDASGNLLTNGTLWVTFKG